MGVLATMLFSCESGIGKEEESLSSVAEPVVMAKEVNDEKEQQPQGPLDGNQEKKKDPGTARVQQGAPAGNPDWDKKILKTAILNLEVIDYGKYYSELRGNAKRFGAYVAQEEQTQSDYKIQNSVVIKVPVDQFDDALAALTVNTEKINEKKISSQDVTTEFIDTRSRMESKRQVRQRYMDLLKQARNMEEILNVQSQINAIQEEIESASGRIEYLGHAAAFSTIHLTFFQVLDPAASATPEKPSFASRVGSAFQSGSSWVIELFLGLITIWPLLLLSFAVFLLYKKRLKFKV